MGSFVGGRRQEWPRRLQKHLRLPRRVVRLRRPPPLGPALGAKGINPGSFIQKFNDLTRELNGKVVGCVVTLYEDKNFDLEIKSSPASILIKEKAGIEKGSGVPNVDFVGSITMDHCREIAE